jgi:hypothetical protein
MERENHTGITEKTEVFSGMRFRKKHTVRSLRSANAYKKKYSESGYLVRVEKERQGFWNIYIRRK